MNITSPVGPSLNLSHSCVSSRLPSVWSWVLSLHSALGKAHSRLPRGGSDAFPIIPKLRSVLWWPDSQTDEHAEEDGCRPVLLFLLRGVNHDAIIRSQDSQVINKSFDSMSNFPLVRLIFFLVFLPCRSRLGQWWPLGLGCL